MTDYKKHINDRFIFNNREYNTDCILTGSTIEKGESCISIVNTYNDYRISVVNIDYNKIDYMLATINEFLEYRENINSFVAIDNQNQKDKCNNSKTSINYCDNDPIVKIKNIDLYFCEECLKDFKKMAEETKEWLENNKNIILADELVD
jgi:hypothetical protein